jgi:hypothetical protein
LSDTEIAQWKPQFAGGDSWRIDGSQCRRGYSRQQAEEICAAHNKTVVALRVAVKTRLMAASEGERLQALDRIAAALEGK